ncbi:hypothetical protein [Acidovorax soli]|uniref:hypothetical protein n=1 Tax=Acidovorax soli TaxID=592050 RepID=UPI001356333D|nr:hypothetical protein [Acidovorax soli]
MPKTKFFTDIGYLRRLITVVEHGCIADAARAGNFTAAAVSQYIRPGSANFV